jgi:hypothetical protein
MGPEMLRSELSLEEIAALEEGLKRDFYATRLLLKNLEEELTDRLSTAYLMASTDESSE